MALQGILENVKQHLLSESDAVKIAAMKQALQYGQSGQNLVFQIVKTATGPVQWAAYDLLWERSNQRVRHKLQRYWPLRSEVGIDYTTLRHLLGNGQWEQADRATKEVMLKVTGRQPEGLIDRESMQNFPSQDLQTIDRLWIQYSDGRFGFSVQKRIWESVVGTPQANTNSSENSLLSTHLPEHVNEFAERVGWRVQGDWLSFRDLTFDVSAPEGHLPSSSFATPCSGQENEQEVWQKWCSAFCFRGTKCGVLFLGWWSLLDRPDL